MTAFISYCSKDRDLARRVAEILRVRNVDVWIDERDLRPGDPLASALISGISAVDYFVILVTEASINSRWMRFELESAVQKAVEGGLRLIPLLFDGAATPELLAGSKWVRCNDVIDAEMAINQALEVSSSSNKESPVWDSHPAPQFGLRLMNTTSFQRAEGLGLPERKYVLVSDYFEQWGRTLREVLERTFTGQVFDEIIRVADGWTGIVFEIGKIQSKHYDIFPATWKAIYHILTDSKRLGLFSPTAEAVEALRIHPRDYGRSDGYPWHNWVTEHINQEKLVQLFGLYNGCFVGETGTSDAGSHIWLVRNLELGTLNMRLLDLGAPDEGKRVQ